MGRRLGGRASPDCLTLTPDLLELGAPTGGDVVEVRARGALRLCHNLGAPHGFIERVAPGSEGFLLGAGPNPLLFLDRLLLGQLLDEPLEEPARGEKHQDDDLHPRRHRPSVWGAPQPR